MSDPCRLCGKAGAGQFPIPATADPEWDGFVCVGCVGILVEELADELSEERLIRAYEAAEVEVAARAANDAEERP